MIIPRAQALTMVFVRALRDGRDLADAARAVDLGYLPSAMSTEQKKLRPTSCARRDGRALLCRVCACAQDRRLGRDRAHRRAQRDAIQGEVCYAPRGQLYLQPEYLLRLYQPMCDERMGNRLWLACSLVTAAAVRETIFGAKMSEADKNAATLAAECPQKTGELREELLPVLWEPGLRRDEYAGRGPHAEPPGLHPAHGEYPARPTVGDAVALGGVPRRGGGGVA